ncbi:MAG TPA: glycosyltransferase [Acidimicrobiales bacterium]|nr:glycosyltransferase [Acidimicrobiales bacterium]
MRRYLRRFAAVGVLVTAIDVGVVAALRLGTGMPVALADAIAIAVAAVVSYLLHRWFTFTDDPFVRWVREPATFTTITVAAGLVDVLLLRVLAVPLDTSRFWPLLVAKAISLAVAGTLRMYSYRRLLFEVVRDEQARRAVRGPAAGDVRLSVVVPAYGEADNIGSVIARLRAELAVAGDIEVIVVDDGSKDGTADAARAGGADQVIAQPLNRGKGAAVRAGMLVARGRTVAFTDADLAYPPAQLLDLLAQVEAGWDMVVGSRRHVDTSTLVRAGRLREMTGRLFNSLTLLVLLGQYRDTQCGIKAFRSDVARLLFGHATIDRFAFDVELFHLAERYRLSLTEVPVTLANTTASTVRLGPDALRMVLDLFRIRRAGSRGDYELESGERLTTPN